MLKNEWWRGWGDVSIRLEGNTPLYENDTKETKNRPMETTKKCTFNQNIKCLMQEV